MTEIIKITSPVEICNLALDRVKENPINAFDDNSAAARWMGRNYGPTRDFTLAAHPWRFSIKRVTLSPDTVTPAFGWKYAYLKPDDCLRVLPLRHEGRLNGRLYPFQVEGNYILTNAESPIDVRYISRVVDVNLMANTPLFIDALAARLASNIAHWMTGKQSYVESNKADFKDILTAAKFADSLEGTHEKQYANAYDDARRMYAGRFENYGDNW